MGDQDQQFIPNQYLTPYQEPIQSQVPPNMSIQPPAPVVPPPLPFMKGPEPPPPDQLQASLMDKFGGGPKKEAATNPPKAGGGESVLESQIRANAQQMALEQERAKQERLALASGLMKTRMVGPSVEQKLIAENDKAMQESVNKEADKRIEADQFKADVEARRQEAYAKFQAEEVAKTAARQTAINKELDTRMAKIDALSDAGTDHFWASREAGAKARALEAIAAWRVNNDMQAIWMHNPGGANQSNAVFDMYSKAIDQDVALQLKNRDFKASQMKERINILGSREAAELSLKKEKFDAMAKSWDALAAQAKYPEQEAEAEVIKRKALATSQGLQIDILDRMRPHATQEVDNMFRLRNYDALQKHPEVLQTLAPTAAKQELGFKKSESEIGKLGAETNKANSEASSTDASKLESQLQKAGVMPMHSYDELFKQADDGKIEGLGRMGRFLSDKPGLSAINSDAAQKNNTMLNGLKQDIIHMRTGAQASDKERIQHTIALLNSGSERDIVVGVKQAKKLFSETEARIKGGFDAKTVKAYDEGVTRELKKE